MKLRRKIPWALVLSGGGAKGFAHIGVLKVLEELEAPPPSLVAGTSMGAIVGGLYACGWTAKELEKYAVQDFDIRRHLDSQVFKMEGPVGKLFQTGQVLGNLATRPGIDSGKGALSLLEELTEGKTFDQTSIPFRCNAVDLISGRERVFSSGSVARAIRASLSFPGFFDPLVEGDEHLADGGIVNNLPIRIAREAGFKHILAVDVGPFRMAAPSALKTGAGVIYRSLEVAISYIQRGEADQADLTLRPNDGSTPFAFSKARSLVALGERTAREELGALEAFFAPGFFAALGRRALGRA